MNMFVLHCGLQSIADSFVISDSIKSFDAADTRKHLGILSIVSSYHSGDAYVSSLDADIADIKSCIADCTSTILEIGICPLCHQSLSGGGDFCE